MEYITKTNVKYTISTKYQLMHAKRKFTYKMSIILFNIWMSYLRFLNNFLGRND